MKNKFKRLSICLLVACLAVSATACFGESGASDSPASSESLQESTGISGVTSESEIESSSEMELSSEEEISSEEESNEESSSEEAKATYTIAFVDYDDSEISTTTYEEGAEVVVPEAPTREADETYTYEFAGWDKEVTVANGDVTYKATYAATYIDYTVKFVDENGAEISSEEYHYGEEVTVPELPTKDADETYTYTYAWDKEITAVSGDATYMAVCTPVFIEYTVTFLNENGSEISTATYHYGDAVTVPETPVKAADEIYTYTFAGWGSEVVAVVEDATYTASFTAMYIDYTVAFVNDDGSEISTATYHYGDAVAEPATPTKVATAVYSFVFDGWDKEIVNVAGNETYKAKYAATVNDGYKVNEGKAGAGESIVLNESGIGGGANYSKGQQHDDGDDTPSFVHQSYLAIDGNFNMDDYVAFDFTGKNMPEVAFFAKNYNDSMYAEGTSKQGIVVVTGVTTWEGKVESGVNSNGTKINYSYPFMIQDASDGGFARDSFANSKLGRANLVDGTHYRVIMGFTKYVEDGGIQLNWYLYNLDTKVVVEQSSMATWNFFRGNNASVNNMTVEDLVGSIVLYGKFGTDLTIDKLHGVYENTTIDALADGLNNNRTYTITFQDENGNELQSETLAFGKTPVYKGEIPTLNKTEDTLFTYAYAWDKAIVAATADTVYKLTVVATPKNNIKAYKTTTNGDAVVLGASKIGDGAHYSGWNNTTGTIGTVDQSYLAFDGNYGFNNYIVLDFTGKNMPCVAFFAQNYNNSMYYQNGDKYGLVVSTGFTTWEGDLYVEAGDSTKDVYGGKGIIVTGPYMLHNTVDPGKNGALGFANASGNKKDLALGRANLDDSKQYRVIMGIQEGTDSRAIKIVYALYNLTDNELVEEFWAETYNFFVDGFVKEGETRNQSCSGSIVLYGHFGTTTTLDKVYGVESGAYADIVAKYMK